MRTANGLLSRLIRTAIGVTILEQYIHPSSNEPFMGIAVVFISNIDVRIKVTEYNAADSIRTSIVCWYLDPRMRIDDPAPFKVPIRFEDQIMR